MDAIGVIVGVSWIFAGLLCAGLAIPLMRGKIGRNRFYGARFPESFASDEAWFSINRYAGKRMLVASLPLAATGVVSLFLPLTTHPNAAILLGFAPLIFVLAPAFATWRFARRYGKSD